MDVEEFLRRYDEGERNFSGIELRDVDLSGIDLSDVVFRRAKLINVDLSNSELWKADLSEADLSRSNLFKADLQEANLRNAILTNTNLESTKLIGANLTSSNINEAINVSSPHLLVVDENNNNTELVTELRELTRGIYSPFMGNYPYDIFIWRTASRGDFTFDKFLEAAGILVEVDSIDFLENTFPITEFSFILDRIKSHIIDREYYYLKIGMRWIDDYDNGILSILIGKTQTGDWVGVCPKLNTNGDLEEVGRIEDNTLEKIEHASLVSILESLDTVKIFSSENISNALEGIAWEIAGTRNTLLHNLLKSSNIMVFYDDYKYLSEEGGFFGEESQEYQISYSKRRKYKVSKILSNIVKTRFKDIKIYWIGNGEVDVYIVGKIETGDWVGICNRLMNNWI